MHFHFSVLLYFLFFFFFFFFFFFAITGVFFWVFSNAVHCCLARCDLTLSLYFSNLPYLALTFSSGETVTRLIGIALW
jgi:hypothetical protein